MFKLILMRRHARARLGKLLIIAVCAVSLSLAYRPIRALASTQSEARTAIDSARNSSIQCYDAAVDAEKAGANVSALLVVLNDAGRLLSKADLAYGKGDYDTAVSQANQAQEDLTGFLDAAESLKTEAAQERFRDFMLNVVGSAVSSVCAIVVGLGLWVFLNRRHKQEGSATA